MATLLALHHKYMMLVNSLGKFTNDDAMKYVVGALQRKLPRDPSPLIRLWNHWLR